MAHQARNTGGPIMYVCDAEADLAAIVNPRVNEWATALAEKTLWLFDGTTWQQQTGGGSGSVATDTIWDAKGDLAAGTGANTASKLIVGADDTILMADAAQATGLKWVASATPSTQAFGDAAAAGTADTFTRGDHKHAMPAAPTTIANDTFWAAKGDLAVATGNDAASVLTAGLDDTILMADSAQATGLKWVASGSPSTQALGDAAATGTADTFTRGDHKHAMPAAAVTASGLTQTTARILGRTTAATGAIEEITVGSGLSLAAGALTATGGGGSVATDTIWDAAGDLAVGTGADTAAKLAITVPGANILNVLGVVNGESTWSVKSVHDATAPAAIGTAAAGTALTASHRDHVHATGAGTPSTQALGDAAATGTGPAAAMTDHKHAMFANSAVLFGSLGDTSVAELASDFNFTTSSTTFQSVTGLLVPISASATEVWVFFCLLEVTAANATMDCKWQWTVPTSCTMAWGSMGNPATGVVSNYGLMASGSALAQALYDQTGISACGSGTAQKQGISFVGKIFGGGTSGNVQLQGAQNTSDAGQLTANKGCSIIAWRIHT